MEELAGSRLRKKPRSAQGSRLKGRGRPVSLLLAVVMCVSLIAGAYLGGRLIYEFGVGGSFGVR